jgi:uncharacterized protein (TIGR02687 family)
VTEIKQINDALDRVFREEKERVVFWNDPEREFQNVLPFLLLENVTLLRLDEEAALGVKLRIEQDDRTGRYLLYSPTEEPDYEADWLLDIRLYSRSFRADRASILLGELGLANQHLRQHIAERRKFFDNKERLQKLKTMVQSSDTAPDLDCKMIAVVAKADQPEFFNILCTLYHSYAETGDGIDLDKPPASWEQIEKFELDNPFWEMAKASFGYADDNPSPKTLLVRLLVTDYAHQLKIGLSKPLEHLVLPPAGRHNAVVCLAQWRDSSSRASSYDRLSTEVASLISVADHLSGVDIGDVLDVMTFEAVEKSVASSLRDRVQNTADTIHSEDVKAVATRRQAGHWASLTAAGAPEVPRKTYRAVYDALVAAADFFAFRNQYPFGFDFGDPATMLRGYETELYRFDQLYRRFCENADAVEMLGWNILMQLRESIEGCYTNWYLPNLALAWGKFLEPQGPEHLLTDWRIDGVHNEQEFFQEHVRPRLEEAGNRRVYVIVSDAFRYEAAHELVTELNGRYRLEATLASQLGVLPSYTALGMASLLPHKVLTYKPNGEILVDGKPTSLTEQRDDILKAVEGMACKAPDLMALKKEQGRELVKDKRVVYVYHNTVDTVGERDEKKTFGAVRTAIDELAALVSHIINNLNGNYVVITADHGFLFTESAPGEPEKSKIDQKPDGTVKCKNRYLIGLQLPSQEAVWHGKTQITATAEGDMEFWIPRGPNRFHFGGGARFVHGGAMLQEVVVPVITVRHIKGKPVEETKVKPAIVHVLGGSHKITTGRHRFELIQMEPISDRVKPVTLKIAVYEDEEPVTNIESMTFESNSEKMEDRKKWVSLVLQDRVYNKKTPYRLVLRDAETGIEQQRVPVIIDRAFTDDF